VIFFFFKICLGLKEYEDKGQPSLERLQMVYNVPVVTVSGNLPDPSKKAVKESVLSAISILFEEEEKNVF
jgi:hypothetical protein